MIGTDGSQNDFLARNINADIDDTTTDITEGRIAKRNVDHDKIIFTRRGVYELIESRLSLELSLCL